MPRPAPNTCFNHNDIDFTFEECQLAYSLRQLGADDDLASEVIKYERGSLEPVNCAGLVEELLNSNSSVVKDNIFLPILADVEGVRLKAQSSCTKWMEYMTGVIWRSVTPSFPLARYSTAYLDVSGIKNRAYIKVF